MVTWDRSEMEKFRSINLDLDLSWPLVSNKAKLATFGFTSEFYTGTVLACTPVDPDTNRTQ